MTMAWMKVVTEKSGRCQYTLYKGSAKMTES